MYIINDTISCNLDKSHFGFLHGYEDTHIYIPHLDNSIILEGLDLYTHYCAFKEAVNGVMEGTNIIPLEEMKELFSHVQINHELLQWLQILPTEDEEKMAFILLSPCKIKQKPRNDCIIEYYTTFHKRIPQRFDFACSKNHINVATWIVKNYKLCSNVIRHGFIESCMNGHLDMAKWIYTFNKQIINAMDILQAFRRSCMNGHLKVAQWLYSSRPVIAINMCTTTFVDSCENGNVETLQWLLSLETALGQIDVHAKDNLAVLKACKGGNLEVLQFLISLEPTRGSFSLKNCLHYACINGYIDVAQWLVSNKKQCKHIDVHEHIDYIFQDTCKHGQLETAQWLLTFEPEEGPFQVHRRNDYPFVNSCLNGHLELAKWLLSLEPTHGHFTVDVDALMRKCRGRSDIVEWLHSVRHKLE